jgi:osmotically-inducible protein OsmY
MADINNPRVTGTSIPIPEGGVGGSSAVTDADFRWPDMAHQELSQALLDQAQLDNRDAIHAPTDDGPRNYNRPDAFILDHIAQSLAADPAIDAFRLDVNCVSGDVSIGGTIPTFKMRQRIELVLASIISVRTVDLDQLDVSKDVLPPDIDPAVDVQAADTP